MRSPDTAPPAGVPRGAPAAGSRIGALDVLVFLAELAVYVAVALAAGSVHVALGVVAVIAMAIWWGTLHSPKARVRLPRPADLALRALWFGIGLCCALSRLA